MNIEKTISKIEKIFDQMGELPDKTADNKKRLVKIEKYLASIHS